MKLLQLRIKGKCEELYSDGVVDSYWCLSLEKEDGTPAGHCPIYELEVYVSEIKGWEPMMKAIENRYVNPFAGFQLLAGMITYQHISKMVGH